MLILRFTQTTEGQDKYHIEIAFEGDGLPRQTATAHFDFKLTSRDQEELRWYLEDFVQYPQDPAPQIAKRIENRITEIGVQLFIALFQSNDDTRDMWAVLRDRLNDIRVEIVTDVQEATTIPWELIRDPKTDTPLALRARSFVRTHPKAAQIPQIPKSDGQIRILLIICRPRGGEDVPFRSVASRLIKGLGGDVRATFRLDVLRPPTFEQLGLILRAAKAQGQPYHVVHFDGHGTYVDTVKSDKLSVLLTTLSPVVFSGSRSGAHGYLLFENSVTKENIQLVDGTSLGKLLVETGVPILVLNACRSAHAEPHAEPALSEARGDDSHSRVRALGSFAQEVMEGGATGVVAMRYNVYVITAARFMKNLYGSLIQGNTLGEAVTLGRKQLSINPLREIAYKSISLQDWSVPVVYEAAPIALFPKQSKPEELIINLKDGQATPSKRGLDPNLPKSPDSGFFGRDETLLALDRAFDTQPIVLLHAYAGNGKTATAAEFARWYVLTGGLQGPVLFTSFEQYKPLARVLDQIGVVFGGALEQAGVHWLALDDKSRRDIALQVLKQISVLWIWDNVEPVAGFTKGSKSAWNGAEQKELKDFLRDAKNTKAKFLLTSRREEKEWLSDLPRRIKVPPMPMQERVQLARALAEKHGRRLADVEKWRPLLEFTHGNPLTITVLVGQALHEMLKTKEQIEAFISKLRTGEEAFEDELSEGREKSLGASLSYGFEQAFNEEERKKLALLHFFQGFVDAGVLMTMGDPESEWCLLEVRGMTREISIALLDRAAEIGLLTPLSHGYYAVHPALPWFFRNMFKEYYSSSELKASRAFVEAMVSFSRAYQYQYQEVNPKVINIMAAEEANMLHAYRLGLVNRWWEIVDNLMTSLNVLYHHMSRWDESKSLVNEIAPNVVDPTTGGPLPGREKIWEHLTEIRARFAFEERQWTEAEQLQHTLLDLRRQPIATAIISPAKALDDERRSAIQAYAISLNELGMIQKELGKAECESTYIEAIAMFKRVGGQSYEVIANLNLGVAYLTIPAIHDLVKAESCFQHGLELTPESDQFTRSKFLSELGFIAYDRFTESRKNKESAEVLSRHLTDAFRFYKLALILSPPDAVESLAVKHNALGALYAEVGDIDNALEHGREAIRYNEIAGNLYNAAMARTGIAMTLFAAGRFVDALEYAYAALRNYETFGDHAVVDINKTRKLIADIEQDITGS